MLEKFATLAGSITAKVTCQSVIPVTFPQAQGNVSAFEASADYTKRLDTHMFWSNQ
jgi:hypothetical protein